MKKLILMNLLLKKKGIIYLMLFLKKEKSLVTDIFYSQLVSTYICECEYVFFSLQKIINLPLLLAIGNLTNINLLLDDYFKEIYIDFETIYIKCKKKIKHKKLTKISRTILIIILQNLII